MIEQVATPIEQPTDQPGAVEVLPLVALDFEYCHPLSRRPALQKQLLESLQARSDFGFNKYGMRLKAPNGRPFLLDAYQELCDAIVYLRGAIAERCPEYSDKPIILPARTDAPLELLNAYFFTVEAAYYVMRLLNLEEKKEVKENGC